MLRLREMAAQTGSLRSQMTLQSVAPAASTLCCPQQPTPNVAADAKSIEISNPHKESERFRRPGHLSWLNSGIYMMEDVDLEEWAADCELLVGDNADVISSDESCYVATLIIQTIPIRGSGGSTVAPIAVR